MSEITEEQLNEWEKLTDTTDRQVQEEGLAGGMLSISAENLADATRTLIAEVRRLREPIVIKPGDVGVTHWNDFELAVLRQLKRWGLPIEFDEP